MKMAVSLEKPASASRGDARPVKTSSTTMHNELTSTGMRSVESRTMATTTIVSANAIVMAPFPGMSGRGELASGHTNARAYVEERPNRTS
jgi:hypothetical protein